MNFLRKPTGLVFLVVLSVVAIVSVVTRSKATGVIGKEDLAGMWQATLTGDTGCGITTLLVTFTLNAAGTGPATIDGHTSFPQSPQTPGCGDRINAGQRFTIESLSSNGSGTAGLSCGAGCGWNFHIQVSPDRTVFNLVDITDPRNFLEGVAIHQ